ncbi:MAG: hypothetical protein OEZ01_08020 [Candidatus Heimdallarchaeota archaeon]|nr:hypothetical protein [Candidatus Heimdallarchaeota archaeon]MDH5645939.1 hypothetical protein [Candidatus Heimdallarchaeota archaeon]
MSYTVYKAFKTLITYMENFRSIESYKLGAKVIRNGLPQIEKGTSGWRDIVEIKNFVEWVLTEEEEIVEIACISDGSAIIESLSDITKELIMTNTDEIKKELFMR